MKQISFLYQICILFLLSGFTSAANCPEEDKISGVDHARLSITGMSDRSTEMLNLLTTKITSDLNNITMDTSEAEDFIRATAADKGYLANDAADIVIGIIADAKGKLLTEIKSQATLVITETTKQVGEQIAKLDPKVHFQADFSYCDGLEDENVWTRGGANKEGEVTGVAVSVAANVAFKAGVSVALDVTCDFKLAVTFTGSVNLGALNPTAPLSGTGRTLTITTTPNWTRKLGGSVGVTAFLSLTIGIVLDADGQFADVRGILKI